MGGLLPSTDTILLLAAYKSGRHLTFDILCSPGESKGIIMNQKSNWKFLNPDADATSGSDSAHNPIQHSSGSDSAHNLIQHSSDPVSASHPPSPGSSYLIAQKNLEASQKELLYKILAPVFFGQKQAETLPELAVWFLQKYGIDVTKDFLEGDEHYEEYQEACQAISDGMSIYEGSISFDNCILAELADIVWENMERNEQGRFRRINTLLEE